MNSEDVFWFAVVGDAIFVFNILQGKDVCDGERVKSHFTIVFYKRLCVGGDASAVALYGDWWFWFPHFGDKSLVTKYVAGWLIVQEEQTTKIIGGGGDCTEPELGCADLAWGTSFIISIRRDELYSLLFQIWFLLWSFINFNLFISLLVFLQRTVRSYVTL